MAEQMTHYSILGVLETATQEEIRAAFTQLMNTGAVGDGGFESDPLAHKRLLYAYKVLGNKKARLAYDKQLQPQDKIVLTDDLLAINMSFSRESLGLSDSP